MTMGNSSSSSWEILFPHLPGTYVVTMACVKMMTLREGIPAS